MNQDNVEDTGPGPGPLHGVTEAPSSQVDKEFAYRSVAQLTAQEFRQLIDGPTAPRNPVIESSERIDRKVADTFIPDEYRGDVQVFHEEDGTVTVVFPDRDSFEDYLQQKVEATETVRQYMRKEDIAWTFGQIGLTLGRIARAWLKGLP